MIDYIRMIRSGLIRHSLAHVAPPSVYRDCLLVLFEDVSLCLRDNVPRNELSVMKQRLYRSVRRFQELFPDSASTITTHMLLHIPDAILRLGPLCNSWTLWAERLARYVRKCVKTENTSIAAFASGYVGRRNNTGANQGASTPSDEIQRMYKWKRADLRPNMLKESKAWVCFVLSLEERVLCIQALQCFGISIPTTVQNALDRISSGMNVDPVELGDFYTGMILN